VSSAAVKRLSRHKRAKPFLFHDPPDSFAFLHSGEFADHGKQEQKNLIVIAGGF